MILVAIPATEDKMKLLATNKLCAHMHAGAGAPDLETTVRCSFERPCASCSRVLYYFRPKEQHRSGVLEYAQRFAPMQEAAACTTFGQLVPRDEKATADPDERPHKRTCVNPVADTTNQKLVQRAHD